MNELITRVKNIQNKSCSLKWGSSIDSPNSIVFAVGHSIYSKTIYLKVESKCGKYVVSKYVLSKSGSSTEEVVNSSEDYSGIISIIINILKDEFPSIK